MSVLRAVRGPALVAAWSLVPPLQIQSDTTRPYLLTFALGGGQYERVVRSCDGSTLRADGVSFRTGGVAIEAPMGASSSVQASAGVVDDDEAGSRGHGGVYLSWERRAFGIGGGVGFFGAGDYSVVPALGVRVGTRDGLRVEADIARPRPVPHATGLVRAGLAYGGPGSTSGFVGWSGARPFDAAEGEGLLAELAVPVSSRWDLTTTATWFTSERAGDAAVSLGMRYRGGGPR